MLETLSEMSKKLLEIKQDAVSRLYIPKDGE